MNNSAEMIGYLATVFLVVSFLPRSTKYIRSINFIACVIFVFYGFLLGNKWPIIISNGVIAIIQLYHLFFLGRNKQ